MQSASIPRVGHSSMSSNNSHVHTLSWLLKRLQCRCNVTRSADYVPGNCVQETANDLFDRVLITFCYEGQERSSIKSRALKSTLVFCARTNRPETDTNAAMLVHHFYHL